ncbi:MAG: family 16 glycoside hydrolase, partial [Dysgonamonadaceae bacterium]
MKKLFYVFSLLAMSIVILGSCTGSKKQGAQGEAADTVVAAAEDEGDWIVLFNGENFDGWRGYNRQDIPKAWTIEDGAIKIQGS